jgi:transcriptional regulator with XRE-family HTH domain
MKKSILHHPLINQSELARMLGVTRGMINQVKSGKTPLPARLKPKLLDVVLTLREIGYIEK